MVSPKGLCKFKYHLVANIFRVLDNSLTQKIQLSLQDFRKNFRQNQSYFAGGITSFLTDAGVVAGTVKGIPLSIATPFKSPLISKT